MFQFSAAFDVLDPKIAHLGIANYLQRDKALHRQRRREKKLRDSGVMLTSVADNDATPRRRVWAARTSKSSLPLECDAHALPREVGQRVPLAGRVQQGVRAAVCNVVAHGCRRLVYALTLVTSDSTLNTSQSTKSGDCCDVGHFGRGCHLHLALLGRQDTADAHFRGSIPRL